jgi:hypothetical protein
MKYKNYLFSCSLWFQEQVFLVKNIIHPGFGKKFIPDADPGVKKNRIPDPQHWYQINGVGQTAKCTIELKCRLQKVEECKLITL